MRGGVAIALAVAGLALAACGGGGGNTSAAEFREQADAICADDQAKIEALGSPRSIDELGEFFDKAIPVFEEGNDKLHELDPPDELAEDWDRAIELQDQNLESVRDLRDAIEEGDDQKVQDLLAKLDAADQESTGIAQRIGLEKCGQESSEGTSTAP